MPSKPYAGRVTGCVVAGNLPDAYTSAPLAGGGSNAGVRAGSGAGYLAPGGCPAGLEFPADREPVLRRAPAVLPERGDCRHRIRPANWCTDLRSEERRVGVE